MRDSVPIAGGIALPAFNGIDIAEKGQGAFSNGERIHVKDLDQASSHIISFKLAGEPGDLVFNEKQAKFEAAVATEFIHMHSSGSVYDTVMFAKGIYSGELNLTSKVWDNIAQHILVEEAGGVYTDFYGRPMDYSKALSQPDLNYTYCAGAPKIHKKLQEIIHSVDSGFPPSRE